jgi:hypothetical protein
MKRLVLAGAFLCFVLRIVAADSIPPVATRFLSLFDQLRAAESAGGGPQHHVAFQLSDGEINEYMRYSLHATPRPGLDSVTVKIFPQNYVSTLTVVDFDAVERWKPGTVPVLMKPVLNGKKTIWVDYRFHLVNGKILFTVEKAYYQSVRLPAWLVEEMIKIVAVRQPEKYDTSKPLPLPFGLRNLWTAGNAIGGEN